LQKHGDGTLTWAGSSAHTGVLEIEDGLVLVTGAGRISDQSDVVVRTGATLRFNGMTDAVNGLSGSGTVDLQSSATLVIGNSINNSQGVGDFFGIIQGTGGELIKRGPGTFSLHGNNTYTGGTRVEGGILAVQNPLATSATGPGPVVVANGGTLGGSGAVAGMVTVQGGGMVAPSGDLSPLADDTGRLTLTDLTLAAESTLQIDLGGSEPGATFDVLAVENVILAGSLEVRLVDGFTPSYGQEFQFLTISEGGTGLFAGLPQGDLVGEYGGTELFIDYSGGGGQIVSLRAGLPGDYNANGTVDAADYTVWRNGLDTKFSQHDYQVWRNNYGESGNGHGSAHIAVPEPASASLLLLSLAIGVGRRRTGRTALA
jgi:autotransporter-associated beta strand protein